MLTGFRLERFFPGFLFSPSLSFVKRSLFEILNVAVNKVHVFID